MLLVFRRGLGLCDGMQTSHGWVKVEVDRCLTRKGLKVVLFLSADARPPNPFPPCPPPPPPHPLCPTYRAGAQQDHHQEGEKEDDDALHGFPVSAVAGVCV